MAQESKAGPIPTQHGVFTRASSGLVRQVRTVDVMFYGWEQIGIAYIIFIVFAWQFYPGANLALSVVIATVSGIFLALCYALVSVVYPRSGGDYVAMRRGLSPGIAMVMTMSLAFWQIFYIGAKSTFTTVSVNTEGTFSTGNPTPLFRSQLRAQVSSTDLYTYDVTKDGQRFLVNRYAKPQQVPPLHVVFNATVPLQK